MDKAGLSTHSERLPPARPHFLKFSQLQRKHHQLELLLLCTSLWERFRIKSLQIFFLHPPAFQPIDRSHWRSVSFFSLFMVLNPKFNFDHPIHKKLSNIWWSWSQKQCFFTLLLSFILSFFWKLIYCSVVFSCPKFQRF